ncbi:MAG TPA: T9SS type A sorting domain-containing protein [Candidatus Krumholzibacteria bacterium]|nr:T9SS type A sorting domain-containing protein [Candidatus Krumholzibacteria bacterium]
MLRPRWTTLALVTTTLALGLHASLAHAAWQQNGNRVSDVSLGQARPAIAPDGEGGAIVAWVENRSGLFLDIYAQRLDSWGRPVWATGGVAIAVVAWDQDNPIVVSDGEGGAIIAWEDSRNGTDSDIFAQRVSTAGTPMWPPNGVAVCEQPFHQNKLRMTRSDLNGVIIVWQDVRANPDWNIYGQRLDGLGIAQWPANGIAVCAAVGNQFDPDIVSDGFGGAIVAWEHQVGFDYDIRAQRVHVSGGVMWSLDGESLCSNLATQGDVKLVSDDAGGAIAVWSDSRQSPAALFAQRIVQYGYTWWLSDGVEVTTTTGDYETDYQVVADGSGGVIVVYNRAFALIMGQRINPFGSRMWTASGMTVSPALIQEMSPHVASDGLGGAIVSWIDYRNVVPDVFARRVDATGVPVGPAGGTPIAAVPGGQMPAPMVSDGAGGAIMAWQDYRAIDYPHVYAQRMDRLGNWGYPAGDIVSALDVPGDQGGVINLQWTASRLDPWPNQEPDRYTVWRAIDPTLASVFASSGTALVSPGELDPSATEALRVETIAGQTYYWQLVSTVDAFYLNSYAQAVPTLFDNTISSPGPHYFQVIAHGFTPQEYWVSAPASGDSFDNLAPAAPIMLAAQRVGNDVELTWNPSGANELDFAEYAVYRASSAGVQPIPGFFVTGTPDTVLVDSSPPPGYLYYIVTARDVHDNQSAPSNEASVTIPTGIGDDAPALTRLTLDGNFPNPFSRDTELRIGLPRGSDVRLEVFDVAGRRVATRDVPRLSAGWQRVDFDGRDARGNPLASGVYFGRITAAGETQTMKMVIRR